jgi:TonB-dependent receptor
MAFPSITTNIDLNNPANYQWAGSAAFGNGGRVNLQDEKRMTVTDGIHGDVKYGGDEVMVKGGIAFDHAFRSIIAIDSSTQWQNAICGDNPNVFLPGPNAGNGVGCNGQNTPAPIGAIVPAVTWPGFGTGFSTGFPAQTWGGSLVPQSALASYLKPGPTGFITVDYNKIFKASNYHVIDNASIAALSNCSALQCAPTSPPFSTSSNTGGTSGGVDEKNYGAYLMADGVIHLGQRDLKWDVGLRFVETHQTIISPVLHNDTRNGALLNGGFYPPHYTFDGAKNVYDSWLPNINVVYDVADDFLVRGSLSRTMTRPDPSQMIAVVNFSDPTAATASLGNPALKPYYSNNIDLGAEYYTGGEGYVSVAVFRKSISNFTNQVSLTEPFSYLAQFGVNYASLTSSQQTALCGRTNPPCNPATATDATVANTTISVNTQLNTPGLKIINGIELGYVQPLDFLLERYGFKGFGFTGNLTIIDQKATGNVPSIALGVAPFTYNVTGYYDDGSISAHLSYGFADTSYATLSNQQSVCLPVGSGPNCPTGAYLFSKAYGQADFSSSVRLSRIFGEEFPSDPELTFDVQNIFSAKQETFFQLPDAVHSYYSKGQGYMFGLRGTF